MIVPCGLGPVSSVCGLVSDGVRYSGKHFRYTMRQSMQHETRQPRSSNENHPHWNSRAPKGADVAMGFVALVMGLLATVAISSVLFILVPDDVGVNAVVSQTAGTLVMGVVLWCWLYARRWGMSDLGFNKLGVKGWHLLWEVPVMFLVSFVVVAGVRLAVPIEDAPDTASDIAGSPPLWIFLALTIYVLAGPFVEEIIFRRLLMGWLDYKVGVVASTILSCSIFALCHFNPASVLWVGVMSVFVALSVRWHNSLWAGYVLHAVNNAVAYFVLVVALLS